MRGLLFLLLLEAVASGLILHATAAEQHAQEEQEQAITLEGCLHKCGDMSVPFPLGMDKAGCFLPGFEVMCNYSFTPPRPFLNYRYREAYMMLTNYEYFGKSLVNEPSVYLPFELVDILVAESEARVYGPITSRCSTNVSKSYLRNKSFMVLGDEVKGPFLLSMTRNVLISVGWSVEPAMHTTLGTLEHYAVTCSSDLMGKLEYATNGSCSGRGCCQATFPDDVPLAVFGISLYGSLKNDTYWKTSPCSYGMVAESSVYNFSTPDLYGYELISNNFPRGIPFVIDFVIRDRGSCPAQGQQPPEGYACVSSHSYCANSTTGHGYACKCAEHYGGNPYITDGCRDINECMLPDLYPCSSHGICTNRPDGYDCSCKPGMKGDAKAGTCSEIFTLPAKVTVGVIGGILVIAFMSFIIIIRKEKRKTREFYEKNGGLTLEKAKIIKLFKKDELKPILKSSNLIGKGGFGEVYKGVVDNVLVAVKRPISGNVLEKEQFANEVIIQSQVIHKNIVRLIGCCLEVDTPMLVYEFLSKGSLDDILHRVDSKEALNLGVRVSIAIESAHGLAYMHSQAHTKILHGDVKPANILLDDNFLPKISDFGISRLIARDKQHTGLVIGDMTYMDPVYLQTGLLTEKSDVYSFGVVILELISRKKATHLDNNKLVRCFLEDHKQGKKATDLFDKEIATTGDMELLDSLAGIAVDCLHLDVDQRQSMADVVQRLLFLNTPRHL